MPGGCQLNAPKIASLCLTDIINLLMHGECHGWRDYAKKPATDAARDEGPDKTNQDWCMHIKGAGWKGLQH